jgi:phosphohistidine phosphatase
MQHAFAYSTAENPERPLTPAGIAQAKNVAHGIKRLGLAFDLIVTSPRRRAHQTAALIAERVRFPYSDIMTTDTVLPECSPQDVLTLLNKEPQSSRILVVGHMPHLANLASNLMQGGKVLIENAGLTCFSLEAAMPATLEFHMRSEHLAI